MQCFECILQKISFAGSNVPSIAQISFQMGSTRRKRKICLSTNQLIFSKFINCRFQKKGECISWWRDWNSSNMVNSWLFSGVSRLGLCILCSSTVNGMFHNHLVSYDIRWSCDTSSNNKGRERVHWKFLMRNNSCEGKSLLSIFRLGKICFVSQLLLNMCIAMAAIVTCDQVYTVLGFVRFTLWKSLGIVFSHDSSTEVYERGKLKL